MRHPHPMSRIRTHRVHSTALSKGKVERPFRDVKERFLEESAAAGRAEERG